MKSWVVVDIEGFVVDGFDADQNFIDNFEDRVVDAAQVSTPSWYGKGETVLDVTTTKPKPTVGWYKQGDQWVDGNPYLTVDRVSIPADGTTVAKATFTQKGPKTPQTVTFNVNGQEVSQNLVNGSTSIDVVSSNPGDAVVVTVGNQSIPINVEV